MSQRYYLARNAAGRVVVTESRPERPALVWTRTRAHAEALAQRLNEDSDYDTTDGDEVSR